MKPVTVYTKPYCPYCHRAIAILEKKGAEINEISAAFVPEKKAEMLAKSNGKRTYPQICIGETHVGGCDDLMALDARGGLDPLLQGA